MDPIDGCVHYVIEDLLAPNLYKIIYLEGVATWKYNLHTRKMEAYEIFIRRKDFQWNIYKMSSNEREWLRSLSFKAAAGNEVLQAKQNPFFFKINLNCFMSFRTYLTL